MDAVQLHSHSHQERYPWNPLIVLWVIIVGSITRSFDDHHFLHAMNTITRLSANILCNNMTLNTLAQGLLECWITQFWTPYVIRGDNAFNCKPCIDFVKFIGSTFDPIPPRRPQNNVPEAKHGVICLFNLRPNEAEPDAKTGILAIHAIDSSN